MRRRCEGGVALRPVSGLVGRAQYAQCIANAGCLSALVRETQRLRNRPTLAQSAKPTLLLDR